MDCTYRPFKGFGRAARLLAAVAAAVTLAGCAGPSTTAATPESDNPESGGRSVYLVSCAEVLQPEHQVELDAIDGLMEEQQYYAALARLESLTFDTQAHWIRWAQLLGQVDQLSYSEEVFRAIVESCNSYRALHGLGVVYVKQNRLDYALAALSDAKEAAPADANIRNDYGYALLKMGQYQRAAFELRTAFELSAGRASTRQNMIAAYYLVGGEASIQQLRRSIKLTTDQIQGGRNLARSILEGSR